MKTNKLSRETIRMTGTAAAIAALLALSACGGSGSLNKSTGAANHSATTAATDGSADDRHTAVGARTMAGMDGGSDSTATALVGRVPAARIPASGALTEGMFASGLTAMIEHGERAVSIRVDESNAVSNLVKPGDTVDVFLVLKRETGADGEIAASHARLLLSKVRVLGFGDATLAASDATATANANLPAPATPARTAVLGVRVEDIDALTLAENNGRLMLALRNPTDADSAPAAVAATKNQSPVARAVAGVSLTALSGNGAGKTNVNTTRQGPLPPSMLGTPMLPPLPAAPAPGGASRRIASAGSIEVIRGSRSESVSNP